jgi:CSLREA domain-containing protein
MEKLKGCMVSYILLTLFCVAGALFLPQGAEAALFRVNSTDDIVDATPGDGVCVTGTGVCTLRAAIQEANALAGADEIRLKSAVYRLAPGSGEDLAATGDLDITDSVTIKGKGAALTVVDGSHSDRVFHVIGPGPVVNFVGLKVQNGSLGTGDFAGGGIFNFGATVIVNSCIITNNVFIAQAGGGILSMNGNLKVVSSRVIQNGLYYGGGPAGGGGIASYNDLSLKIIRTKVADNFVFNLGDTVATNDIAFGGGIGISGTGTVKIKDCKILGNVADSWTTDTFASSGAGLHMSDVPNANIINTKIANNICSGLGEYGGGVFALSTNATFSGCLITENSTLGGLFGEGGGMYLENGGTASMTITITNLSSVMYNYAFYGGGIYVELLTPPPGVTLNISADSVVANNFENDIVP